MGRACRTCGGEIRTESWCGNLREGNYLEDSGVDVRIILKWNCEKWHEYMDSIGVAQHRVRWLAVLSAAMNLRVL